MAGMRLRCWNAVLWSCVIGVALAGPARGAGSEDKARAAIQRAGDYIAGLDSVRVRISTVMRMEAEGMKQEYSSKYLFSFRRPDRLASVLTYGFMGATIVSDGKKLYRHLPMMGRYMEEDAPASLEDVTMEMGAGMMGGGFPLMTALISKDPADLMLDGVKGGEYLRRETLAGVPCDVVRFEQDEFTWDAWVEIGEKPLLRRVVPDLTRMLGEGGPMQGMMARMGEFTYEMHFDLTDWEPNAQLPDDVFVFTPPEGVEKTDSMFGRAPDRPEKKVNLKGASAPDFSLKELGGGTFDVSSRKGKVVILDFWATWCGPCRRALPIVAKVAGSYGDKVELCAVNEREEAEEIREFLTENKITCTVALDVDGSVGEAYGVTGIPQTVIIDANGIVRSVHVGLIPDLEETLREELDALVGR